MRAPLPSAVSPESRKVLDSSPESGCHLLPGIRIRSHAWGGETAVYFEGAGETMVVSALGEAAIEGLASGASDLPALERWCREHGFVGNADELRNALAMLSAKLAEHEIIESSM